MRWQQNIFVGTIELDVIVLRRAHLDTWRTRRQIYWLWRLFQEFVELAFALLGLHRHSPEWELKQIASIAMNWLEKRAARRTGASQPRFHSFTVSELAMVLYDVIGLYTERAERQGPVTAKNLAVGEALDKLDKAQFRSDNLSYKP